ncbi:MAG: hypothetical protein ACQEV6_04500 [Pseudomonadota bacterium]
MGKVGLAVVLMFITATVVCAREAPLQLSLSDAELEWIGDRVFQNECAGRHECLVHWNVGEAFPSLGIGHFIWYPEGEDGRFVESFPALINHMTTRSVSVPDWLSGDPVPGAPWSDRKEFQSSANSKRVTALRGFLAETKGVQAEFILSRARASLDKVVAAAPTGEQATIRQRLRALSASPGGTYALIDYVNFKGEGLSPKERYQGQGWGLLQVLRAMSVETDQSALLQFRKAAAQVLTRRADNAENPIEKQRWLPGWLKRLETYREPAQLDP